MTAEIHHKLRVGNTSCQLTCSVGSNRNETLESSFIYTDKELWVAHPRCALARYNLDIDPAQSGSKPRKPLFAKTSNDSDPYEGSNSHFPCKFWNYSQRTWSYSGKILAHSMHPIILGNHKRLHDNQMPLRETTSLEDVQATTSALRAKGGGRGTGRGGGGSPCAYSRNDMSLPNVSSARA